MDERIDYATRFARCLSLIYTGLIRLVGSFYFTYISTTMNPNSQYKLLWLVNAMTLPVSFTDERYYYDGQLNDFFYTIRNLANPASIGILNLHDLHYSKETESDLAVRLELIDDESSEIIEIPRLTIADKVEMQLYFLSQMPGTFHHNDLIKAAEEQQDDHKFVFDEVLTLNENSAPLASYWNDFKFNTVISYLHRFARAIAVDLNLNGTGTNEYN